MGQKPRAAALICELMEMYIAKSKDMLQEQQELAKKLKGNCPGAATRGRNGHQEGQTAPGLWNGPGYRARRPQRTPGKALEAATAGQEMTPIHGTPSPFPG